jgi:DNA-3-methyladenine glycosylase
MEILTKNILTRGFYERDTSEVARELLGRALIKFNGREMVGGIIIETEAYYGRDDPASHAYGGRTQRSRIMFEKPGTVYVYLCYGMYYLLNVVTETIGKPGAVLIRGLKPVWGVDIMKKRRKISPVINPADGPGKLTIALGVNIKDNGADIVSGGNGLYIFNYKYKKNDFKVAVTERIGIKKGKKKLLRFLVKNC